MSNPDVVKKLENFLECAINPDNQDIDITAIDGFCTTIQLSETNAFAATKLILPKIQSINTIEAINALNVLEECMAKCGSRFQSEVGKFRFLNGLIELISKKHRGGQTPKIIRDKILDLLLIWTVQYSHETKIKEAYETLRKQGETHDAPQQTIQTSSSKPAAQNHLLQYPKPAEDEMSKRLKKLLQSKDPLDVKAANLLIKSMVEEEEKRVQMKSLRLLELKKVDENVSVLEEMLDHYNINDTSEDELSTIKELFRTCEKLHPTVIRLAQDTQENEENIDNILEASDRLTNVFAKYKEIILSSDERPHNKLRNQTTTTSTSSTVMFDLLGDSAEAEAPAATKIDTKILSTLNSMNLNDSEPIPDETEKIDSMKELSQVFEQINKQNSIVMSSEILQPQTAVDKTQIDKTEQNESQLLGNWMNDESILSDNSKVKNIKAIPDLDSIVSGMLYSSLNKITNDETSVVATTSSSELRAPDVDDDIILNCEEESNLETIIIPVTVNKQPPNKLHKVEIKSLADIKIDLDNIKPSKEPPRIIMNDPNGLKIVLNFAEDHPRPDVSVIVVSVVNQDAEAISGFQFDASVSKFCKLRLLEPSGSHLAGVKPFRPPADDITQVLLYSNPKGLKNVNMVCILSYCVGDDPDPIRESIEVKDLPFLLEDVLHTNGD